MSRLQYALPLAAALTVAAAATADHIHMTVDTFLTIDGPKAQIVAGYLSAESAYTIADGRLLKDSEIAVFDLRDQLPSGTLAGWYGGFEILLTSDYFYITGRLDGGNFMWELASVTDVRGGPSVGAAWGSFGGSFNPEAISTAPTRPARSCDTGAGGHEHNQGYAFETPGLYDLTFILWDSNGVYLDSDPVLVRFRVGCPADFNGDGFVDGIDADLFNNAFEAGHISADYNGDGFVDGIDSDQFNNDFETGC